MALLPPGSRFHAGETESYQDSTEPYVKSTRADTSLNHDYIKAVLSEAICTSG